MSYETLDTIADAYIPLLGIIIFLFFISIGYKKEYRNMTSAFMTLTMLLFFAYGFMALDHYFQWWIALDADYSTHTAVALSQILFIHFYIKPIRYFAVVSFMGYIILMLYQEYHTLFDIVSTGIVFGIAFMLGNIALKKIGVSTVTQEEV